MWLADFLSEEKKFNQRTSLQLLKIAVSLLKFPDENNIAKLVVDMWEKIVPTDCVNRLFPNLILFKFFFPFGVVLVHDARSNDAQFMHKLCKHASFI